MLFHANHRLARTMLPLAFFGALVSLLVVSENLGSTSASTITVQNGEVIQADGTSAEPDTSRCKGDDDCPSPTTFCSEEGRCTAFTEPICNCGQPNVLRCYDQNEKARFKYCKGGCMAIEGGAICQE